MSTLIKKEYVIKENKLPAQYRLTDAGRRLAIKLINGIEDDDDDDGDRHENSDDTSSRLDRDRSSSPKSARYDLPRTESVQSFAPLSIDADSQNSRLQFDAWPQPSRTTDINDDVIQLSDNDDNEIVEISEDPAPFQRLKQQPEVSHKSPESFKTKSKQVGLIYGNFIAKLKKRYNILYFKRRSQNLKRSTSAQTTSCPIWER